MRILLKFRPAVTRSSLYRSMIASSCAPKKKTTNTHSQHMTYARGRICAPSLSPGPAYTGPRSPAAAHFMINRCSRWPA